MQLLIVTGTDIIAGIVVGIAVVLSLVIQFRSREAFNDPDGKDRFDDNIFKG